MKKGQEIYLVDSIGQLRLIMSIEQTFNYQLSVDEVVSINSVKDIIDIISNLAQGEEIENKFGKASIRDIYSSNSIARNLWWPRFSCCLKLF